MKIEQIKQIGEILNNLGDKTVDGLIVFLGYNLLVEILGYAVGIAVLYVVYKLLSPLLSAAVLEMQAASAMRRMRDSLKIGCSGVLVKSEIKEVVKKVESLIEKKTGE